MQYAYKDKKLQYAYCTKTFSNAQVKMDILVQTHQQATTSRNKPSFVKDSIHWGLAPAWLYCDQAAGAN
jgi:hypothetical protein